MGDQSLLYYKLFISQLVSASLESGSDGGAGEATGLFDDDISSNSLFRYETLSFKNVWIQGNVQLFDTDEEVSSLDANGSNDQLLKSTSSTTTNSDLTRFMLTDEENNDLSYIMVVKPASILTIDIVANQYILVAGTLVHDIDEDIRFILIEKMADLSSNAQMHKDLWKLELNHIQSKVYNISKPINNNNNNNNNNKSNNSIIKEEDDEDFQFPVDEDEEVDQDVSRIECQDESRYSFHNDEYEEVIDDIVEQQEESIDKQQQQQQQEHSDISISDNTSTYTYDDSTTTNKSTLYNSRTNDTEISEVFSFDEDSNSSTINNSSIANNTTNTNTTNNNNNENSNNTISTMNQTKDDEEFNDVFFDDDDSTNGANGGTSGGASENATGDYDDGWS
ncbi:hypothetical protein PPL_12386 [Heterostelium album PN500]|uniref:Uncharacterized protein n=1 Tax=Heterostelium pallidum (strain ATCC 26659 / Pp 5 / PN500) TaxID=670386 RepID=D3BMG6_HETP5|nr:hypothetical protein PPL_12386 [Heterostelium album PN500]EFA77178.1 hypothetical protein PPL_12386 [Heterostelium album PN500]|eukprot:XP_020429307.1 hypothetical protein PPL_12386 [Heterostelium album PN500]